MTSPLPAAATCTGWPPLPGLIAADIADSVLLIGAEAFTTFVNPQDRATRPIFGDGAGAATARRTMDGTDNRHA